MKTERGFWDALFSQLHDRQRSRPEPNRYDGSTDIRTALFVLREFSGMTREQLAARIGIMPHTLKLFESRGGLFDQNYCDRCAVIARDFDLHALAEFFKVEGMMNSRKQRRGHRSTTDEGDPMAE